ncbi:MAG: presqualene diphosphate synthase HpnD [Deltaproteobacteria bacterium]|nr:presqualene diphosphate synthase HpnD [Deltaproteobacteria bacterium]
MDPMKACREILRRSGSTFAPAFRVLPSDQRDAMTAFYAFCREVDDAVDGAEDPSAALQVLDDWRRRVAGVYEDRPGDPVSLALRWSADRFSIRREHLDLVLDGVEQDLTKSRYGTFDELYEYCYRVASAVGLVCVTVLGDRSDDAGLYAELTGIGVQMTNILRDVGEDAAMGRIYLPMEDLRAFGVAPKDILRQRMTEGLKRLLRFEALRARQYYDMAGAALPPESRHRLFFAEILRETYRELLEMLEGADFQVFERRVSVGKARRMGIALRRRLHPATWLSGGMNG